MGCGASSEKGRESHSVVAKESETFFPPGTRPGASDISKNTGSATTRAEAASAAVEATTSKIPQELTEKRKLQPVVAEPPQRQAPTDSPSPRKKKSPYVPPAPITHTPLSSPEPSIASRKTVKDTSASLTSAIEQESGLSLRSSRQQSQFEDEGTVGDEASYQPDDILNSIPKFSNSASRSNNDQFDEDRSLQEEDFHGLLDLHQSGFDQGAVSVITSMTTNTKDDKSTTAYSVISEYEYPVDSPEPNSSSGMRFDELYRLKGVLGTGAFSTVREGFHRSNSTMSYAVKCINRKKLSEEDEAALLDEVSILKEMKHDHIIRLFDFFEESSTYYLVMERMRGGELFDRIVAKAYYNEKEARDTCKIVLEAVRYCHENHVAHRDLKPENLLLLSDVDDSAVKIADFGFAKKVYEPNSLTTQCGTPGYVAPEILEGTAYDQRADMWSVGVILYILLGGYPPFIESTQRDLFRKIRKGDYEFHEEYWGTVSAEAKDLISSLLTVDSRDRLTADEALENAWILGDDAKLASKDLGGNLNKLRNFNGKRKFRAAVSTVMAVNKLNIMGGMGGGNTEFFSKLKDTTAETTAVE